MLYIQRNGRVFLEKLLNFHPKDVNLLSSVDLCAHVRPERSVSALKIQKASEDYLEAMLMLKEKHGYVRSVDVAEQLGVTKPSVSYATKRLRENGYILMDPDGLITLTDAGQEIAERIYERHKLLSAFLIRLGVDEKTALEDACKIEHDVSQESFDAIRRHAEEVMRG